MQITPFFLGSGKASTALLESLKVLEIIHPEYKISTPKMIKRGQAFRDVLKDDINPVLFIANPHALHTSAILEAELSGFKLVICEKPAAISLEQIQQLKNVKVPVAICHVYRQAWGIQTLKKMIELGEFGDLISIEGRYWQSSVAQKSMIAEKAPSWKNDPSISGPFDVLMDIGVHWADAATYLMGERPVESSLWLSYANTEAKHRDTHAHLQMSYPKGTRAMASVSKTIHGAPNHFEINIIGTRKYGCWKFLEADQIELGLGSTRSFIARKDTKEGSGHWPFHGLGWIEGYIEIMFQAFEGLSGREARYPTLPENLAVIEDLLNAKRLR